LGIKAGTLSGYFDDYFDGVVPLVVFDGLIWKNLGKSFFNAPMTFMKFQIFFSPGSFSNFFAMLEKIFLIVFDLNNTNIS
jgi:hypothetical protein